MSKVNCKVTNSIVKTCNTKCTYTIYKSVFGYVYGLLTLYTLVALNVHIILLVPCFPLTPPQNGKMTCSLGDDGALSYRDTCTFTCDAGYELFASETRTCHGYGRWSGTDTICVGMSLILVFIVSIHVCVLTITQ